MTERPPARGIFFWFFALSLPAELASLVFSTATHEFAHGLVALALGGWFLGTKSEFFSDDAQVLAYADAWSESGELWVYAAGICANVALGAWLYRRAGRTASAPARVLLWVAAGACLSDLGYAFEGCLHWRTADTDSAIFFDTLDSPELRWLGLVFLFPAWALPTALVARGSFQAWGEILGPLSVRRALGVLILLAFPLPWALFRGDEDRTSLYLSLLIVVGATVWILRSRRSAFKPAPPSASGRWIGGTWAAALLAAVGAGFFEHGLRFGTYPDHQIFELRPEDRTVAGLSARFGMSDARGENRPAYGVELFAATPEGAFVLPSPESEILDLTWRSSSRSFLVVTRKAIYEVGESGTQTLWEPGLDAIRAAAHGPDGELLLVNDLISERRSSLYAYDARARVGREFTTEGDIGYPFFLPGQPVRARIGVGQEIWELTWDEDGARAEPLPVETEDGWYAGTSADGHWWSNDEGWWSGDTWIANEKLTSWGVGLSGFYTLDRRGRWRLTTPHGRVEREGRLESTYYAAFQIHEGLPWLALKSGEVRRLDAAAPPFHVKLPAPATSAQKP